MTDTQNVTTPTSAPMQAGVKFVNLFKVEGKDNCFYGEKDGNYFYMFPCSEEWRMKGVEYRTAGFKSKEAFDKRMNGERVDGDFFFGIGVRTSKNNPENSWLGGILNDNEQKKAWYVTLKDNQFKKEGRNHDKYLQLKEATYLEKKQTVDTSTPREGETTNDVL